MKSADLVMLDLKHIDPPTHKRLTGWKNDSILALRPVALEHGKPCGSAVMSCRAGLDEDAALVKLAAFVAELRTVKRVEVLPYHTLPSPNGTSSNTQPKSRRSAPNLNA